MDQVWLFYERAQENRRLELLQASLSLRTAFHASKEQWKKYVEEMMPKAKGKKPSKPDFDKFRKIQRRLKRAR